MSQTPPRRQTSMAGMVGAMIVTVGVIIAFVVFRSLVRGEVDVQTEEIDYLEAVQTAQQAGLDVVHPRSLPADWKATSVDLLGGDRPEWGLGVLTASGSFVGLRQEDESVGSLVDTYIDEEAVEGDEVSVETEIVDRWTSWSDDGGDLGYSTELDEESLLVYGSASQAELEEFMGLLTR